LPQLPQSEHSGRGASQASVRSHPKCGRYGQQCDLGQVLPYCRVPTVDILDRYVDREVCPGQKVCEGGSSCGAERSAQSRPRMPPDRQHRAAAPYHRIIGSNKNFIAIRRAPGSRAVAKRLDNAGKLRPIGKPAETTRVCTWQHNARSCGSILWLHGDALPVPRAASASLDCALPSEGTRA
jgi:hypothetical protein